MRHARFVALPLLALALLPGALADDGAPPPDDGHGPRLHVEDKTLLFDEVIQGQVVDLKVDVFNRGDAPLLLTRAEPSCGCTVLPLPEEPIPPGGKAELTIRFDSKEKLGAQSLQILLYSNDPTQNDLGRYCTRLMVQGDVRSLYRVSPAGAFFGEYVRGVEAQERVVTVLGQNEARGGFTARIEGELPDHVVVATEPVPGGEGGRPKGLRLRVRVLPHAPVGELNHAIELVTDVPAQPRVRVPVIGMVIERIVGPEALVLGRVPRATGAERRATIERRDEVDRLVVRRVTTDVPWLALEVEPMNSRRVDLKARVAPGAPVGPFAGMVRVFVDDPHLPFLQFPVFGLVLPRVTVDPGFVRLGEGPVELTVRGGSLASARVEPADAGVRAEVVAGSPARVRLVGPAAKACRLVLETDVPGEERVEVPIEP